MTNRQAEIPKQLLVVRGLSSGSYSFVLIGDKQSLNLTKGARVMTEETAREQAEQLGFLLNVPVVFSQI